MKWSVSAIALSLFLLFAGLTLTRSDMLAQAAFVLGVGLLSLAVFRLIRMGARGNAPAWEVAALPAAVLTWVAYELIRQTPPYVPINVFGVGTAPVLSVVALVVLLTMAWRTGRSRPA
jgi:hypothetical protein